MPEETDIAVLGVVLDANGVVTGVRVANRHLDSLQRNARGVSTSFGTIARRGALALGALAGFATIGMGLRRAFSAMTEFETGLVAVEKTANLTEAEFNRLREQMLLLERVRPDTANDLLEISAAAGQLGVSGVNDIVKFTDVMADLAMSSDVAGESGAKAIARIIALNGEGIDSVDRFASSLVMLGNNAKASEGEILQVASEVARGLANFNLTTPEVLGFATAARETDQRPQLVGSSLGRVARTLNEITIAGGKGTKTLEELSDVIGRDIGASFQRNAAEGIMDFLGALDRIDSTQVPIVLKEMGLAGEEINKVIPVLAKQYDNLVERMEMSSEAYRENIALEEESAKAKATLANRLVVLGNNWTQMLRNMAESTSGPISDFVDNLTTAFQLINQGDQGAGLATLGNSLGLAALSFGEGLMTGILEAGMFVKSHLLAALTFAFRVGWEHFKGLGGETMVWLSTQMQKLAASLGTSVTDSVLRVGLLSLAPKLKELGSDISKGVNEGLENIDYDSILKTIKEGPLHAMDRELINMGTGAAEVLRKRLQDAIDLQAELVQGFVAMKSDMDLNLAPQDVVGTTSFFEDFADGWATAAKEFETTTDFMVNVGMSAFQTLDVGIQGLLDSWVDDFKLTKEELGQFFKWMAAEMARMVIYQTILRPLLGSIGGLFGGTAAGIAGAGQGGGVFSGSGGGSNFEFGPPTAFESFDGVMKRHSGDLAPYERKAIIRQDESVLTRSHVRELAAPSGQSVNMPISVEVNVAMGDEQAESVGTTPEAQRKFGEMLGAGVTMKIQQEIGRALGPGGMISKAINGRR